MAVLLTVLPASCSPDVQLRLVSVDELYRDTILQDGVTMVEDTIVLDRRTLLRRRYSVDGEGVLDEFIRFGRSGWGAPIGEYLDARVFFSWGMHDKKS
ncbi:MAG: hypothetical protein JKX73_09475 [Flavobacteriales bacterium]|nr:hypothetical protein [Flavobacteriales bacterium]